MACTSRNLVVNGDFRTTLRPWTGNHIQRVKNPHHSDDYSVLMGVKSGNRSSTLSQTISFQPEYQCAYYLTFRLINVSPKQKPAQFYATVAYLDRRSQLIRSTPLLITPPNQHSFKSYFTIVPPPPKRTTKLKIVFLLRQGLVYLDTIRLVSRTV